MCSMKELVILAFFVSALHAASLPKESHVEYKCLENQDSTAKAAAEKFINQHHRHGYKFKIVSQDSRSAKEKSDPCEVVFGITLEETDCHIVNPKPLDQCAVRTEAETKVTAKCNVTISGSDKKPHVKSYICNTEPGSHEILVKKCPDCPSLLPLHDPKALESVKSALQKYNKASNHKSQFKLMEVGRISTQWMPGGQSFFVQFAIMETNCTKAKAAQDQESCKSLCGDQARYGFCKATKVGTAEPIVECELYQAQNFTLVGHPAKSKKDCKQHGPPHHAHPGHGPPPNPEVGGQGPKDKGQGQKGRPEHASPDAKEKKPDQRARPEHGDKEKKPDQKGHGEHADKDKKRPEHPARDDKDKKHEHKDHPEHPCPKGPSAVPGSATEGRPEFPCHGVVKIPPSIYPICPFPPPRLCLPDLPRPSIPPPRRPPPPPPPPPRQ